MSTWRARASAASVAGACVFAVVTGAGSVFVGAWWGQHHGPVVVEYVNGPTGGSRAGTSPGAAGRVAARTRTSPAITTAVPAEPDSDISTLSPRAKRGPRKALRRTTGKAAPAVPVSTTFPAAPPGPLPPATLPPGTVPPSPVPTGSAPPSLIPTGPVPTGSVASTPPPASVAPAA